MEIKVVRDISELETLEGSWNAAVENSSFDSVFATYEWFYSWVRNFGKDKNVRIIVCRDGDKLLGVFPLLYEQKSFMGMKIGTLRSATNLHTPKYDFIVNGNGKEIIRSVFDFINKIPLTGILLNWIASLRIPRLSVCSPVWRAPLFLKHTLTIK
jgi:hypothetical protein